jgi:protein-tyrosine-phosphatase
MDEIGIDIRSQWSKALEEVALETVEAVVTLCAEADCPVLRTTALREAWPLPDPVLVHADPAEGFRVVRDDLRRRLAALFGADS